MGVYVPVHVILSLDVIVAKVPFATVISSSLEKPATASEKINVTVDVSPILSALSLIVKDETVGAILSMVTLVLSMVAVFVVPSFPALSLK